MLKTSLKRFFKEWIIDFFKFIGLFFSHFVKYYLSPKFAIFESAKSSVVGKMYQQRGKHAQLFVNVAFVTVMMLGVALGPSLVVNDSQTQAVLASGFRTKFAFAQEVGTGTGGVRVMGLSADSQMSVDPLTQVSEKPRADVFDYTVAEGDTLAAIATKFGVDVDSIKWLNSGVSEKKLKPETVLHIPPVTGVIHTVRSGETIYSIAKRYNVSAQSIVDFPFNEFTNDETFAIAIGQTLTVPDGVMPAEVVIPRSGYANLLTPNAGAVSATGNWIWPTQGAITQLYKAWHKGLDIANHGGGNILAADSGTIVHAGWVNSGYGNMVMIDHGNGYVTLYAHMLANLRVKVGQTVKRGDVIGSMGSTGRSTGTHLHFEVRTSSGNMNPQGVLK